MNYIHKSLYFWELFCNFEMRSINPYKIYSYDDTSADAIEYIVWKTNAETLLAELKK